MVDASTTQLADTRKNQKRYPQPAAQKPGCGFPVLRFVALFSLTSGAILNVILGSLHHHDLRLLRGLWDQLKKGDILLGDRAYGEYTTLATGPQQGVDVVARLHARRKVDFRKARRLGKNDGLFVWTKGYQQSEILSATQWSLLPAADYSAHGSLHRHHPRLSRSPHHLGHHLVGPRRLSRHRT